MMHVQKYKMHVQNPKQDFYMGMNRDKWSHEKSRQMSWTSVKNTLKAEKSVNVIKFFFFFCISMQICIEVMQKWC